MSNALLSLAAGFGGGYLQAKQRAEDQVRLDEDRSMRKQLHDAQMGEINKRNDLDISLSNAAGPLKATEIIDVDPSNPGAPRKTSFSLSDGRTLGTREEVDKATADWNKPEARTIRLADAYRAKGKVTDAISLEDSFQERERKRKEFDQKQADEAAQRRIYGTRTPDELAGIVSDYPHDGHSGGLKARVVMSDDKKSWQVEATKPDGTIERWPGIYSNDAEGLTRAQAALYGTFNPAKKMEFFKWDTEQGRKAEKDAADGKYKAEMLGVAKQNAESNRLRAQRTGAGGGAGGGGGTGKPLPATALKMQGEALDAIGAAAGIQGQISTIQQQIKDGKLNFGAMSNTVNDLRNATGYSSEESKNFASFKATLEKMRNDSLRLNSGVQTDGDAQRAWNELVTNINDKGVVEQRLAEIAKLNERAETLQKARVEQIRNNYGAAPMDLENIASPPKNRQNAVAPTPVKSKADIDKLPSGAVFVGPDGKQRIKP